MSKRKFTNMQVIALGFAVVIASGTFLLMLPVSSASGSSAPFMTAFFTSVSAACVTGLVLVDTAAYWSVFGQLVILALIQIGGLGFMTIATFFISFAKKNIDLRKRQIMAESINSAHIAGLKNITRKILLGTVAVEGVGAAALSVRFVPEFGLAKGIYYGFFHSVSAFCNAGFDLMGVRQQYSSLSAYTGDALVNITIMFLIVTGGIGFLVWQDIFIRKTHFKMYQLHTKIVLTVTAVLIFGGAFLFFVFEREASLAGLSFKDRVLASLFSSVSCRTAGFNTVDFAASSKAGILLMCALMFVGGSSGSTAGGIKTTTLAVVISYLSAELKGIAKPGVFGRTYVPGTHKKAVMVFTFNLLLIFSATVEILALQGDLPIGDVLFEVCSAMGTVGLSTGITRDLSAISKIIIIILMYCGRVGSVSFALALFERRAQPAVKYPCEAITVG